jgi:hypothetical protein
MSENKGREPEIEITPEMIEAGIATLRHEAGDDYTRMAGEAEILKAVFRAMATASPSSKKGPRPADRNSGARSA